MSFPQEYHYTAQPQMPHCQGSSCYCFQGTNQMNACDSDSDSDSDFPFPLTGWHIVDKKNWTVALNELKFRHPRVLLAYFRFVSLHNEIAEDSEEAIHLPHMPKDVKNFILNHISLREPPAEFEDEVNDLRSWVLLISKEE